MEPAHTANEASEVTQPVTELTPPLEVTSTSDVPTLSSLRQRFSPYVLSSLGLFLLILGVGLFLYSEQDAHVPVKQFASVYSLVPEKISKSAPIYITVPAGIEESVAQAGISFSPAIEGEWQIEEIEQVLVFRPAEPLRSGVYYAVNLDTEAAQMSGDFYVDEDPEVTAVFPVFGTESHEDSEITIVFNRPMVPLTTLTEQESISLPITISPPTPGRFKWISTRNLQFVPETTLVPSSDYTVTIGEGLFSVDGLPVAPLTHTFVTRPLRYEHVSNGQIGYREPIIIQFNQPVDLVATMKMISVETQNTKNLPVEIEYGEITYYDRVLKKYVTEPDQSKLFVYQKDDQHGRSRLWDFNTRYSISISGGVPLTGNKPLTAGKKSVVTVPSIIKNVTAASERSSLVRPNLFDPAGTLTVSFYDDVSIDRSTISAKGLTGVTYGERCRLDVEGNKVRLGSGCEIEVDTQTLIFTFNPDEFTTNESFFIELARIVTPDGFRITQDSLQIPITTYPKLSIARTVPETGSRAASAGGGVYLCTNTPLRAPREGYVDEYLHAEGYVVYGRMNQSRFIDQKSSYDQCSTGEFETWFQYGLMPETFYSFEISLTDAFAQTAAGLLAITTAPAEARYTRFHNLQKQYNVTPPTRTKLTYAVENLEYVNMHICRLEPEEFLARTIDQDSNTTPPRSNGCLDVVTEQISLPVRYWVNNYFQVDLAKYYPDPRGHYIVTFSHPLYTQTYSPNKSPLYDRTYISVTNLAVGKKEVEVTEDSYSVSTNSGRELVLDAAITDATNLYWVNQSATLSPVVGASIAQYQGGYKTVFTKASSGFTDSQGIARTSIHENLVGAVVRFGLDSAVITDWSDTLQGAGQARDASRTYVYTDRPIYRPGHTVHIRGIDRIGFDGTYEVWNTDDVRLEVFDSRGARIYEVVLVQNDYGTFSTDFELPSDAALGTYRIKVFGQSAQFAVEEYVPAAFKLEVESNQTEYTNGDALKLEVQADYYFGVPLRDGTVSYSVTAQDYYFDRYTDEYFNFGQSWYQCYFCDYGDDFLFRGEVPINNNGRAVIERVFTFEDYFDDLDQEGSKLVTVSVTAKDSNGRSVSLQKSFIVHKGEFYIGAKTDEYYTGVNTPLTLRVKTVDQMGESVALSGIERTVSKVSWETSKRQEVDGGFYYRSNKKLTEVSRDQIKTDSSGNWNEQLTLSEEGQYEVQLVKNDSQGNRVVAVTTLYIYGTQSIAMPPNNNYELELEAERINLDVGDMGSILIKSPYQKAKVLITAERGTVYDYWIADVTGGLYVHEFPIKSEYAPNVFVSAMLLSTDPEVKYGSIRYEIGSEEHDLVVDVTANKVHYLPGESVTLTVETKDYTGRPVPAEVSLAVADLSVLALKGNPKKNPAVFFYDGFPLSVSTASNIRNILYEVDIPLGTKGGGGANPDDLAAKKRGLFKDTAFWSAAVMTDQNGQATVTFTLPDNLTTWQVEGLGVTKDTKLGVDYLEFMTKKDLMAVPLKPRFVIPGDTFSLGAKVFNQTDAGATIDISLESSTLQFTGDSTDSVFINAGESKTVYFEVVAPSEQRAGSHTFTFTASAENFVDIVEQVISITPNTTYETVATANFTRAGRVTEYMYVPDTVVSGEGGLTINANATMAVFMTDALSYMVTYPYGCSEQLASSLSTIGTLTSALSLPSVEGDFDTITYDGVAYTVDEVVNTGLVKIYEAQTLSGGFAYYKGLEPNLYLSMHVVDALVKLKAAGYDVRTEVITRATTYIESAAQAVYSKNPKTSQETIIMAEYILRTSNGGADTALTQLVTNFINDKAFINEKISSLSLAYLAIITADSFSRAAKNDVYAALKNRIDIDGRGAYLPTINTARSGYFETPIKNTALLLKVFAVHDDEHPAMGNVLRWLLASRDSRGVWGGTHNTFSVVDGMIDYLRWQEETSARFSLKGLLQGKEIFGFEFNPTTVFKTFSHFMPIDTLPRQTLLPLTLEKTTLGELNTNLYYDISLKYFLPVASLPPRDEGITITRNLFSLTDIRNTSPVTSAMVGEIVKGKISITIPDQYSHVAIEDIIPAGFEIVNFNLATEDQSLKNTSDEFFGGSQSDGWFSGFSTLFGTTQTAQVSRFKSLGGSYGNEARILYPTHMESHDDRVFLYVERLPAGVYEYEYFLRALVPGEFQHLPARAEELFFPEVFGRTEGNVVTISSQ